MNFFMNVLISFLGATFLYKFVYLSQRSEVPFILESSTSQRESITFYIERIGLFVNIYIIFGPVKAIFCLNWLKFRLIFVA